jgi:hypothetical protein
MAECCNCKNNINKDLEEALQAYHEEDSHDDLDNFVIYVICIKCKKLLKVEFVKVNEEIISIETV